MRRYPKGAAHGNFVPIELRACVVCHAEIPRRALSPSDYREQLTCSVMCGHRKRSCDAQDWTLIEQRFWRHVDRRGLDECWPWLKVRATYYKTLRAGYGVFRAVGRNYLAHDLAWIFVNGPVPDGLCVLHRCDNPPCCNPRHLWTGTQRQNMRDAWDKGRMVLPHEIGKGRWPSQREALRD
jgi:hypothetical protein